MQSTPTHAQLLAELQKPSSPWMPHREADQPKSIIIRVTDRYTTASDFSGPDGVPVIVPVLVGDDVEASREWIVKAYSGQLQGKVERLNPQPGDLVGISYLGRPDEDDPKSPHRHNVRVFERAGGVAQSDTGPADVLERPAGDDAPATDGDGDIPF